MADANDFLAPKLLGDWTITNLQNNSQGTIMATSGTTGTSSDDNFYGVTSGVFTNGSNALASGLVGEVIYAEVYSPVVNTATGIAYPDVQWWLYPDANDLAQFQYIDGSYGGNMMPPLSNIVAGAKPLSFGVPMWKLLGDARKALAMGGNPAANMATKATGIKFVQGMQIKVSSTRGWGPAVSGDTVINPLRVRLWGYTYNQAQLNALATFNGNPTLNGSFRYYGLRRVIEGLSPIAGVQAGVVGQSTWTGLPGGYAQTGGAVIHRYAQFSQNLIATGTSNAYPLTNNTQIGGTSGNVAVGQDMGYGLAPVNGNATQQNVAYIIQGFGVVPGIQNIANAGFNISGNAVPGPNGYVIGQNVLPIPFGNVQPLRTESGDYFAIPQLPEQIELAGENAYAFVTPNGTAIGIKTAEVAAYGLYLKTA